MLSCVQAVFEEDWQHSTGYHCLRGGEGAWPRRERDSVPRVLPATAHFWGQEPANTCEPPCIAVIIHRLDDARAHRCWAGQCLRPALSSQHVVANLVGSYMRGD